MLDNPSFRQGARDSALIILAVGVFGVAYGVLAVAAGFPIWLAILSSLLIVSGAAQFAMIGLLPAGPIPVLVAVTGLGLRHVPMSAALDFKLIEVARYFTINAPLGRSPFLVAMNQARYDKLAPDLRKLIDETTGLSLSLKGAQTYDTQNTAAIEAAKKDRELIALSADEHKRWLQAFRPLINSKAEEGEKAGLPARGLLSSYGVLS